MNNFLFKYLDWSKSYIRDSFIDSTLYFSDNFSFNDPFDLQLPILMDIEARNKWFIDDEEKSLGRKLTQAEIDKIMGYLKSKEHLFVEAEKKWRKDVSKVKEIEKRLGVLCLSKTRSNMVMWGHYSKSHSGICIGYDYDKLVNFLNNSVMEKVMTYEVQYSSEVPKFDTMKMENEEYLLESTNKRFSTKHIDWQYEKEVRIIITNFARKKVEVPSDVVSEIIFGYRTSVTDIKAITLLSDRLYPDAKLFKASPNKKTFKMDIVEL